MKTITIKNKNLGIVGKTLEYPMAFAQGRVKRRFMNIITPHYDEMEKSRLEICKKFADKDKKGEPKIVDNKFVFSTKNQEEFSNEIDSLFNEEITIDVPQQVSSEVQVLRSLIENSPVYLTNDEVGSLDEVMESLEKKEE